MACILTLEEALVVLKMANPNPKTDHLTPFTQVGKKPLSKKPVAVRVPQEDYDKFMAIPKDQRSQLLRQFIRETIEKFDQQIA